MDAVNKFRKEIEKELKAQYVLCPVLKKKTHKNDWRCTIHRSFCNCCSERKKCDEYK